MRTERQEAIPRAAAPQPLEVPVFIPCRGAHVGAVVTVPDRYPPSPYAVVLMAGRARDRAHRNGMWVRAAAELAARGAFVLRLDYPGVGNSSGPPEVFDLERPPTDAVRAACSFLLTQTPVRRILLVGTCFGGRVVLEAASDVPEVEAVAVLSAPVYSRTRRLRARAKRRVLRLMGREADPGAVLSAAMQRREGGLPLEARVSPGFARSARRFSQQGTMYFLYASDDFVWEELQRSLPELRIPEDRYAVEVVAGEMHSFRSLTVQTEAIEKIVRWCSDCMDPSLGRPA